MSRNHLITLFILFLLSLVLVACGTLEVGVEPPPEVGEEQTLSPQSAESTTVTTNEETAGEAYAEITIGTPAPQLETMPTAPPFRLSFGLVELLIITCAGGFLLTGAISVIYVMSRARQQE